MEQLAIPFLKASFPKGLHKELGDILDSGYVGPGESVQRFERALKHYLGAPSLFVTSSCTAALTLAYVSAGIRAGSVILSTPMTCAATNVPLLQLGAAVKWLDVDAVSGNVTVESLIDGFNRYPAAHAVVVMDWGGVPCEYPDLADECHRRGAVLIVDAAQSFGTLYANRRFPPDVDYVCYSFGPTKLLSAVEGGAIATTIGQSRERIRALRWYGIRREQRHPLYFWEYELRELGYRFTSNNMFAAIGLRMLSAIESRLRIHRALAESYDSSLVKVAGLRLGTRPLNCMPNFWLYTLLVEGRERLIRKLHRDGIHAATPHLPNDRLLKRWTGSSSRRHLVSLRKFSRQYLCLPIGPWVKPSDVERISNAIRSGW